MEQIIGSLIASFLALAACIVLLFMSLAAGAGVAKLLRLKSQGQQIVCMMVTALWILLAISEGLLKN